MEDLALALDHQRRELGMTRIVLARRCGIPFSTVQRILSGRQIESDIANVDAIASAIGMVVQMDRDRIVSDRRDPQEMRKTQAHKKARHLVGMVQATMALEAQAVEQCVLEQMVDRTVNELLSGLSRRLWDE